METNLFFCKCSDVPQSVESLTINNKNIFFSFCIVEGRLGSVLTVVGCIVTQCFLQDHKQAGLNHASRPHTRLLSPRISTHQFRVNFVLRKHWVTIDPTSQRTPISMHDWLWGTESEGFGWKRDPASLYSSRTYGWSSAFSLPAQAVPSSKCRHCAAKLEKTLKRASCANDP